MGAITEAMMRCARVTGLMAAGAVVAGLGSAGAPAHARDVRYRVVAMTGQAVPFAADREFVGLSAQSFGPVISQRSEIASLFGIVEFAPNGPMYSGGMLLELDGMMHAATMSNEQVPTLAAGVVHSSAVGNVSLDSLGRFLLPGSITGTGVVFNNNQICLLSTGPGAGSVVLRTGDPVANLPGAVTRTLYDGLTSDRTCDLGESGAAVFQGEVLETGASGPTKVLWYTPAAGVTTPVVIARVLQPAPQLGAGIVYRAFTTVAIDQAGAAVVLAKVGTASATFPGNAIYRFATVGESPQLLARDGQPLPGTTGPSVGTIVSAAVAPGNRLAFTTIAGVNSTLWIGPADGSGEFRRVTQAGTAVPGGEAGWTFASVVPDRFAVNRRGQSAFMSLMSGPDLTYPTSLAIFTEGPDGAGQPRLLAKQGVHAPGAPAGVNIASMDPAQFGLWSAMAINARGQTAYYAYVTDPTMLVINPIGLYAAGRDGTVHEVARMGAPLTLGPGLTRTVQDLPLRPFNAFSPTRRWFSDRGELVFTATFVEGGSALIVATVDPCPGDANGDGDVGVQDIFEFLIAWFAQQPRADINGIDGVTVQDIFDFLASWFGGCA
jgi:hypothetical protein